MKEAATRRMLLVKTQVELDKILASAKKTKNSKEIRAGKVVNKYKMAKFVIFKGGKSIIPYKINLTEP